MVLHDRLVKQNGFREIAKQQYSGQRTLQEQVCIMEQRLMISTTSQFLERVGEIVHIALQQRQTLINDGYWTADTVDRRSLRRRS